MVNSIFLFFFTDLFSIINFLLSTFTISVLERIGESTGIRAPKSFSYARHDGDSLYEKLIRDSMDLPKGQHDRTSIGHMARQPAYSRQQNVPANENNYIAAILSKQSRVEEEYLDNPISSLAQLSMASKYPDNSINILDKFSGGKKYPDNSYNLMDLVPVTQKYPDNFLGKFSGIKKYPDNSINLLGQIPVTQKYPDNSINLLGQVPVVKDNSVIATEQLRVDHEQPQNDNSKDLNEFNEYEALRGGEGKPDNYQHNVANQQENFGNQEQQHHVSEEAGAFKQTNYDTNLYEEGSIVAEPINVSPSEDNSNISQNDLSSGHSFNAVQEIADTTNTKEYILDSEILSANQQYLNNIDNAPQQSPARVQALSEKSLNRMKGILPDTKVILYWNDVSPN